MIRPRDSLPSLAPAPSRDFPALRRILPFTLPYRMHMAGAVLALLVSSAAVLGLGQGSGIERDRLCRRKKRGDRIPLGGGQL